MAKQFMESSSIVELMENVATFNVFAQTGTYRLSYKDLSRDEYVSVCDLERG